MGIEEVKKEILDSAKKEAKQKLNEAEKEKREVMTLANEKIEQLKTRIESEADKIIDQYKKVSVAEANSKIKRQKLSIQKEMINMVFDEASKMLNNLPSQKRIEHLNKLLTKAHHALTIKKVFCNKKDISYIKNYKTETIDILGGVIVEDSSGEIRVDLSYESILEQIQQNSLSEMSKLLFE